MRYEVYEKEFRERAIDVGYSEDDILLCLNYAKNLIGRKFPVIYNSANLAALVGYKRSYLKKAAYYPKKYYREFTIRKKNENNVGYRTISEPLPSLKEIQDWIAAHILKVVKINRFAKAYIPKRNIVDNARFHKNQRKVISLDIENFFSSINIEGVTNIFRSFGYSSKVSSLLAKLCCLEDCLPQGASTSPTLSNIYMHPFDKKYRIIVCTTILDTQDMQTILLFQEILMKQIYCH